MENKLGDNNMEKDCQWKKCNWWILQKLKSNRILKVLFINFFFFLSILGKIAETVKRPVIARGEEGGRNEQAEDRGFLGQWKRRMYDTTVLDTCHCTFVQTHRTHNTESEP